MMIVRVMITSMSLSNLYSHSFGQILSSLTGVLQVKSSRSPTQGIKARFNAPPLTQIFPALRTMCIVPHVRPEDLYHERMYQEPIYSITQ
jgi:hypothetical protein